MKLLGVHGKAQSGKDTFAMILRLTHGFQRMAFADPVKRAAAIAFGIPEDIVFNDVFKQTVIQPWGITGREILQKFGTESMRDVFRQDFWITRWEMDYVQIKDHCNVVVTDVRFEDEAERIRSHGGVIVHLHRNIAGLAGERGTHRSEAGIAIHDRDIKIENNGSIGDLAAKAGACLDFINQEAGAYGFRV